MKSVTTDTVSTWRDKMGAYLQGHWPILSVSRQEPGEILLRRRARRWVQEIRQHLGQLSVLERADVIEVLASVWRELRQDPVAQVHYAAFKSVLAGPWQHWREHFLDVRWIPQLRVNSGASWQDPQRYRFYAGLHSSHAVLVGSPGEQACPYPSRRLNSVFSATLLEPVENLFRSGYTNSHNS